MTDEEIFYKNHRGGNGAVVVVTALDDRTHTESLGVFGSIEMANEWRRSLGDTVTCIFVPYIVDDPDWGNETPSIHK